MSDYVPPGLGRVLEDLISKHVGKGKPPTALDVHYRHAEHTRRLMAQMQKDAPPAPPAPKPVGKLVRRSPQAGLGRKAYDWAKANGKSAVQAAKQFDINPMLIQSHRRYYGLPSLVDGRVTDGKSRRVRRRNAEVKAACKAAYDLALAGMPTREAALKHGLTIHSIIRYCQRNKLALPTKPKRQES